MKHVAAVAILLSLAACGSKDPTPPKATATQSSTLGEIGNVISTPEGQALFGPDPTIPKTAPVPLPAPAPTIAADPSMPTTLTQQGYVDPQQASALFQCRRLLALRGQAIPPGYSVDAATKELHDNPQALMQCERTRGG